MAKIIKFLKKYKIKWTKKLLVKLLFVFILGLITILGNQYREKNYAQIPLPGETADEYSFGWLGLSLIKDHYPIAWSGIEGYKNYDYQKINVDSIFDKNPDLKPFSINKPWFDHPPLMGLIVGGYAYLKGARNFVDTSVILLRRPMLKIAIINTILIFFLASLLFNKWIGLISSFLYSFIPSIVISSRLAVAENGYIPLYLTSLIFIILYLKKKDFKYWIYGCIVSSFAVLFKLSALAIPLTLFITALTIKGKDRKKLIFFSILSAILPLFLFTIYGAIFDISTFINILKSNTGRFYGSSSEVFYSLVNSSKITTRFYTDGWILAGWISIFILSFFDKEKSQGIKLIVRSIFSNIIIFMLLGSESYGWYRFVFYPFLVMSLSFVLKETWSKLNIFTFMGLILLPFGTSVHRIFGVVGFQKFVPFFRISLVLTLFSFISSYIFNKKISDPIKKIFMILVLSVVIYFTIKEILYMDVGKWYFAV